MRAAAASPRWETAAPPAATAHAQLFPPRQTEQLQVLPQIPGVQTPAVQTPTITNQPTLQLPALEDTVTISFPSDGPLVLDTGEKIERVEELISEG